MPNKVREKLGRIVATRELTELSSNRTVVVSIGAPRRHPKGDWECPFSVEGLGKPRRHSPGGVDSLQALLSAIEGARVMLDLSGGHFAWSESDPEKAGSGIPRYVPTHMGALTELRMNIAIERESKRYFERALKRRKANTAALAKDLKQRREILEIQERTLALQKVGEERSESDLKEWKPEKTRRLPKTY